MVIHYGINGSEKQAAQNGIQLWVTHSRLFETNSGIFTSAGQALLVDPGIFPDEIQGIQAIVLQQQLTIRALLLTHSHWDHILGPERLPGIPVIAQGAFGKTAAREKETLQREIAAWESENRMGRARLFDPPTADLTFDKEMEFFLDDESLHLLAAPGHSPDQCVIYNPHNGVLWAADMLSDLEIPFVSSSLDAYRQTLNMIASLEIRSLIPGHGHGTDDPREIQARLKGDRAYLDRLAEKVSQAVAQGKSMEETVKFCARISYRQGVENAAPHRLNVESAYLEISGAPVGTAAAGWGKVG